MNRRSLIGLLPLPFLARKKEPVPESFEQGLEDIAMGRTAESGPGIQISSHYVTDYSMTWRHEVEQRKSAIRSSLPG